MYAKIKDQFGEEFGEEVSGLDSLDDLVGKKYLFRTVTTYLVGHVHKRLGSFLVLHKASWVADTGRFADAINSGTLNEVEPVGDGMLLNLDAVVDAAPWKHPLPTEQK